MNNEPVAWMYKDDDVITNKFKQSGKGGDCFEYDIPLYTHTAKTLTDLEIDFVAKEIDDKEEQGDSFDFWYREFARAILKKAQEND